MTLPHQDLPFQKNFSPSSRGDVSTKVETKGFDSTRKESVDNFVILQPFKSWLINKNYSPATIRNYLSDTNQFFDFAGDQDIFSSDTITQYLKNIAKDSNYSRYLSSLSKFFQFALDQSLTKTDPLKAALKDKKPSSDEIINQYSQYLNKKHFSESTIKNYLNDIKQFIDWSKSPDSLRSSAPFEKSGLEKKSSKFKFLVPLLHRHAVVSQQQNEGWSKGKAFASWRTKEILICQKGQMIPPLRENQGILFRN